MRKPGSVAFANRVKIDMLLEWQASGMPQAEFERPNELPNVAICEWKSRLRELQKSDRPELCARAAKHPQFEVHRPTHGEARLPCSLVCQPRFSDQEQGRYSLSNRCLSEE